jgi:hypothetical protein
MLVHFFVSYSVFEIVVRKLWSHRCARHHKKNGMRLYVSISARHVAVGPRNKIREAMILQSAHQNRPVRE